MAENHKFAGPVYCPRCKSEDVEFDSQEPLLAVYETPSMQNIDSASPYQCRRCMQAFYLGYDRSPGGDHSVTIRAKAYSDGTTTIIHTPEGPEFE